MNISLMDENIITKATFVEDGYSNKEITSNILLPFEGKNEDQSVKLGDNHITYEHEDNKVFVDGIQRTFGDTFLLAGRKVSLAKGSIVIVLEDTLQKDFPYDGIQSEIVNNSGAVTYGDICNTNGILIEAKQPTGETVVTSYVFFRDPNTDQRLCAVEYTKTVDELQQACTSSIKIGYIDNSNVQQTESVLEYNSKNVNIKNTDEFSISNISTIDVDGICFNSNSSGVILGNSVKFGIFYDEVNDRLQIKYYDDIAEEFIVKKEFSN